MISSAIKEPRAKMISLVLLFPDTLLGCPIARLGATYRD